MINKVITYYAERLEEFLKDKYPQPEGIVEIAPIGSNYKENKNKVLVSILNLERETANGFVTNGRNNGSVQSKGTPILYMNLNFILAAIYDEKRYAESLSALSLTLLFVQAMPSFKYEGITYTVEIVSLNSQEFNNIWTTLGGQYYPSVLCKLRMLTFDASEIQQTNKIVKKLIVEM